VDKILDQPRSIPEKMFHYPLYERFLFVVPLFAGIAMVAFWDYIRAVLEEQGKRGWAALALALLVLFVMFVISVRGWVSRIIISPTSIKAKVFGQGYIRISWQNVVRVVYKWRLLGHKLVLVGSDGASIGIRSSIRDYDTLLDYIHENVSEEVADQLEEIFGEPEEEEIEEEEAQETAEEQSSEQKTEDEENE